MNPNEPDNSKRAPRTRETSACSLRGSVKDISNQLQEDRNARDEESDPPIVVRDGRTDHMAKGRAGSHRSHSTDARGRNAPKQSISSTLTALNRKAEKEKKHRFRSLYRLIDKQMLYDCFHQLKRGSAPGVDGIIVSEYEKALGENLESLLSRLIGKRYRIRGVRQHFLTSQDAAQRKLPRTSLSCSSFLLSSTASLQLRAYICLSFKTLRYPGLPESSYILTVTEGLRRQILGACGARSIDIRPLAEYATWK